MVLGCNAVKANAKIDTLQMQAIMLVHTTGFSIGNEYSSVEKIVQQYSTVALLVQGINDCVVFKNKWNELR